MVYDKAGSHSQALSAKNGGEHNLVSFTIAILSKTSIREDRVMTTVSVGLRPLGDRVVVKAVAREAVTKSGIVLPDTATEKPQEGEVLAVGPGKVLDNGKRSALEVQVGQRVLFAKYAGTEVKVEGQEYLILRESDIVGIVE
jgi:chaperonin GroES